MFNGTTTTHTRGSDGLRRRTVKGADTTDYILDGDSVIRTLQNGVLDKTYFHGLRGPEYERTGAGNPTWYVYDALGSVVGLLDVNGSLVSTRKYDVYGSVRGGTGISGSKHKFVGSLGHPSEDDAGLISKRARWMDPTTGTFTSEDPARDGENWYPLCRNNSTCNQDRTGLFIEMMVTMLMDEAKDLKDYAAYRAIEARSRDKVENAVIQRTGLILGALAAAEMGITCGLTMDGFYFKNILNGAQIHVDLSNRHRYAAGPNFDSPLSIRSSTEVELFLDGFMKRAGF